MPKGEMPKGEVTLVGLLARMAEALSRWDSTSGFAMIGNQRDASSLDLIYICRAGIV